MDTDLSRINFENQILTKLKAVDLAKPNQTWIQSQEFSDFLDSWKDLVEYHKTHKNAVMGMNLIDAYLEQSEILRAIFTNDQLEIASRERARTGLANLEYYMRKVLEVASTYNDEDND